jgi:hypothetical protein
VSSDEGKNPRADGEARGDTGTAIGKTWSWIGRHKVLAGIAVLLVAILIHDLAARSDRPEDNPQPRQRRLVQGSFPYDRGWELRIETSHYSRNPACRKTAKAFFLFPQAEVTRQAWRTLPVMRDGGNRYRFEFFDDAILPGECDWQLKFVNYVIVKDGKDIQGGAMLGFLRFNVIRYGCANVRGETERFACLQDDNRRNDPTRTDQQIDFIWEETK